MAQTVTPAVGVDDSSPPLNAQRFVRIAVVLANVKEAENWEVFYNTFLSFGRGRRVIGTWTADYGTVHAYASDDWLAERLSAARKMQRQIRALFDAVIKDPNEARRRRRSATDVRLQDVAVETTLELGRGWTLKHLHGYAPRTDEAAFGLLSVFLLDPHHPYAELLRRCELPTCEQYFLAGADRRKYCSDEHTADAERIKTAERVRKHRAHLARKHK